MSERVVFITGGGTGIGRAAAEAFVARGDRVLLVGRREEPLRETVEASPTSAAGARSRRRPPSAASASPRT